MLIYARLAATLRALHPGTELLLPPVSLLVEPYANGADLIAHLNAVAEVNG
jgi:hypothetical protein